MNKSAIRFLGIGIFLAGASLQVQAMVGTKDITSTSAVTQKAYDDSQQELQNVKEQLAQLQLDLQNAQKGQATTTVNGKVEQEEKVAPDKTNKVLIIEPGMNTTEISASLEQKGIIQNRQDLEDYLIAQNLSGGLQIGEYELNSSMTIKQIAEIITN